MYSNNFNDIIVFGSWNGIKFDDNSKALFDYLLDKHPNIKTVIILNDVNNCDKKYKKYVYEKYSFLGIYFQLVGRVYFFTHGYSDFSCFSYLFPKKKIYFQMYHGIPLKINKHKLDLMHRLMAYLLFLLIGRKNFDYFLSTSSFSSGLFDTFFGNTLATKNNYEILGYPRNDVLFSKKPGKEKKILYMPTFRPYKEASEYILNKDYLSAINQKLKDIDSILYLKLHPIDALEFNLKDEFKFSNILLIHDSNFDLYEFLGEVSILITDYSSVYFDFLLIDRPIIFFPFDLVRYRKEVGFTLDYEVFTPGKKAFTWEELGIAIEESIHNDSYKNKRTELKNLIHTYQDNKSSERIYNFINSLAGKR